MEVTFQLTDVTLKFRAMLTDTKPENRDQYFVSAFFVFGFIRRLFFKVLLILKP